MGGRNDDGRCLRIGGSPGWGGGIFLAIKLTHAIIDEGHMRRDCIAREVREAVFPKLRLIGLDTTIERCT